MFRSLCIAAAACAIVLDITRAGLCARRHGRHERPDAFGGKRRDASFGQAGFGSGTQFGGGMGSGGMSSFGCGGGGMGGFGIQRHWLIVRRRRDGWNVRHGNARHGRYEWRRHGRPELRRPRRRRHERRHVADGPRRNAVLQLDDPKHGAAATIATNSRPMRTSGENERPGGAHPPRSRLPGAAAGAIGTGPQHSNPDCAPRGRPQPRSAASRGRRRHGRAARRRRKREVKCSCWRI